MIEAFRAIAGLPSHTLKGSRKVFRCTRVRLASRMALIMSASVCNTDWSRARAGGVAAGWGLISWPVHTNQLTVQRTLRADRLVNTIRLAGKIRVNRANNNAGVLRTFPVQADEVTAIQRQDGAVFRSGEFIWLGLVGFPGLLDDQHVVAERAQFLHHRQGKVLVGLEPRHQSASFSSI